MRYYMMENKEKNFVSIVIYIHNVEEVIKNFLATIEKVFQFHFEHFEIICVNDCSTDKSINIIKEFVDLSKSSLTILNMSYFQGLEKAIEAGIDLSIGDYVFEFNPKEFDFNDNDIIKAYSKALAGFDIVGVARNHKTNWFFKTVSLFWKKDIDFTNAICKKSFYVISRRAINRIDNMHKYVPDRNAVYLNCGLKSALLRYNTCNERPAVSLDRFENYYKLDHAIEALILFTKVGYYFSVTMTVIMMLITILIAIYSLIVYMFRNPVEGWTTIILFSSFAFFGIFAALTVIIKYLQIIVDLVFYKEKYTYESIERISK